MRLNTYKVRIRPVVPDVTASPGDDRRSAMDFIEDVKKENRQMPEPVPVFHAVEAKIPRLREDLARRANVHIGAGPLCSTGRDAGLPRAGDDSRPTLKADSVVASLGPRTFSTTTPR